MEFTPVTPTLARMHGKLGEMLHYKFFTKNQQWKNKVKLGKENRSLTYFREWTSEVVEELAEANRGALLTHPTFTKMIVEASNDDVDSA